MNLIYKFKKNKFDINLIFVFNLNEHISTNIKASFTKNNKGYKQNSTRMQPLQQEVFLVASCNNGPFKMWVVYLQNVSSAVIVHSYNPRDYRNVLGAWRF